MVKSTNSSSKKGFPSRGARVNYQEHKPDGTPLGKSQRNIRTALIKLSIELFYNEFTSRAMVTRDGKLAELNDAELLRIFFEIDALGLKTPKEWFIDCVINLARANVRNPVIEKVDSLVWDKIPRLDGWLVRHAGGEDTPFAREAFKLAMIAAVARVRRPGIKFDQIPVLEGPQGAGKSTFLQILAGGPELFTDALPLGADEKVTIEITDGKIIVELGELRGATTRDLTAVKHFASRQSDRARLSYGRLALEIPRKFTIWGTTNDSEYLADPTGNRRFWPLAVGMIDLDQARADRDQLWAEAAYLDGNGHSIALPEALWQQAAEAQRLRVSVEVWEEPILRLLAAHTDRSVIVTAGDVLIALGLSVDRQTKRLEMRAANCLKALGFEKVTLGKGHRKAWLRGTRAGAVQLRGATGYLTVEVSDER